MTKKYFGTDGIRGAINSENINGDMFFKFGLASGTYCLLYTSPSPRDR